MAMVNNERVLRKVGRIRNPEATSVAKNCGNSPWSHFLRDKDSCTGPKSPEIKFAIRQEVINPKITYNYTFE